MIHFWASFGPVDQLNPDCGYQLRITDDEGHDVLFTSQAPDTGDDLRSPADCLRVIEMYVARPRSAQPQPGPVPTRATCGMHVHPPGGPNDRKCGLRPLHRGPCKVVESVSP